MIGNIAISAEDISKTYRMRGGDTIKAISSISFNVYEGEFLSIVGPSGCGKSTLLKMLSGLIAPSSGKISVFDKQVVNPIQNVGFVFQSSLLMPWRNVINNVLLPVELLHLGKSEFKERAVQLLETVGLKGFESRYPRELSGGMQQRVAIARALLHDPPLLLMDEPFGALDEITRDTMGVELLRITEGLKKTVVFVTHSIPESVLLSDRVIVLSQRPAIIKKDIKIDLARPRNSAVRTTKDFGEYCQKAREALDIA